ncbi:MAG: AAA domain-containing protein, partial [Bacteroidota bacterium]
QPEKRGVINYVQKNRMKIILNSKDLPDWLGDGLIGVDLMFDETSYLEMEKALLKVMKAKGDRLAELRDILFAAKATNRKIPVAMPVLPQLNNSQVEAVHQILQTPDVAVIHGPPGTGKTTTLVQAIRQATQSEAVVLVTAPSNAAVDLLTERIAQQGINVVRIGNISRIDESLLQHTLDLKMSSHPDSKHIKKVKIQAADYRRMARKYKRSFGRKEREQRNLLHKEARELSSWANQLEDRLLDQILHSAAVITCTLVGASQSMLDRLKFKTVFIDEAAQALEPATWIPILRASKVVLAGDPFQLPPTVKSNLAMRQGFNKTMIERCIEMAPSEDTPSVSLLKVQYRMNEKIMAFSNRQFYDNQLRAAEQVCGWSLGLEDESVVSFIDTAGCSFDEKINPAYQSRYNPDEYN